MSRRLIADIGGTNARFALAEDGVPGPVLRLPAADYPRFGDALEDALARLPGAAAAGEAAIAAAGPVVEGAIDVTNLPWRIEAAAVAGRLGGARVRLVNDLEAVALALPHFGAGALAPVRSVDAPARGRAMIAVNAGSGFGAATAVPTAGGWTALAGEPGHMRFAAATEAEGRLLGTFGSVEDLLSGGGLARLHRHFGGDAGTEPAAVFAAAGRDPAAAAAVDLFAAVLGRVTGDLVLATGAWSGACLCGSLACHPRGARFEKTLLAAMDDKGAMTARIARVPVWRITAENPALTGLAAMAFGG